MTSHQTTNYLNNGQWGKLYIYARKSEGRGTYLDRDDVLDLQTHQIPSILQYKIEVSEERRIKQHSVKSERLHESLLKSKTMSKHLGANMTLPFIFIV